MKSQLHNPFHQGDSAQNDVLRLIQLFLLTLILQWPAPALTQCGPPVEFPGVTCEDAPLLCLQNLCSETTVNFFGCCANFCGINTAAHNPQYFLFYPTESEVNFTISVDYCSSGRGLQAVIIGACPWVNADVIDCAPNGLPGLPMHLAPVNLIVGAPYWLLIDGSVGDICGFTITEAIGIESYDLVGTIDTLMVQWDTILPGSYYQLLDAQADVGLAHGYLWEVPSIGLQFTSQTSEADWYIPCDIQPGEYEICVRAFSGCDTSDIAVCNRFFIQPILDKVKAPQAFCADAFPFFWHQQLIEGPGIYSKTFTSPDGCSFDSVWQVDVFPVYPDPAIDTLVCEGSFRFGDTLYTTSGSFHYTFPGQGANGCDSSVFIHLLVDSIGFFIETQQTDADPYLQPVIYYQDMAIDSVTINWYSCTMDSLLSDSLRFTPDTSGCYCLILSTNSCADTVCSYFTLDPASFTCDLVPDAVCGLIPVLMQHTTSPAPSATYYWTISDTSGHDTILADQDSFHYTFANPGRHIVRLTVMDSSASYSCTDTIEIHPGPLVSQLQITGSACDTCIGISLNVHESPVWDLFLINGIDTQSHLSLTDSVFETSICPPTGDTLVFQAIVYDQTSGCPAHFVVPDTIISYLAPILHAEINQIEDTLCAYGENVTSYRWTRCGFAGLLAFEPCYSPPVNGCYCVELSNSAGCSDSICYTFIETSVDHAESGQVFVYPSPAIHEWTVELPAHITYPVRWELIDIRGIKLADGTLREPVSTIQPNPTPSSGVYILRFTSGNGTYYSTRVMVSR